MEGWEAQGLERPDKMGENESSNTANEPKPSMAQNIKDEALGHATQLHQESRHKHRQRGLRSRGSPR